tara:strand:- start:438 stop:869 length:432 start_codon:yes stop_codon:yes gene_type:complete
METEEIEKHVSEKFLRDFNNHLALEQQLLDQVKKMEKTGLQNTIEYKRMVGIKTEQSYFISYMYRLIELLNSNSDLLMGNISPENIRIKRMIQVWKKADFKFIRNMRKDIGDDGVNLMKKCVNNSILKVNEYISDLGNSVKDL